MLSSFVRYFVRLSGQGLYSPASATTAAASSAPASTACSPAALRLAASATAALLAFSCSSWNFQTSSWASRGSNATRIPTHLPSHSVLGSSDIAVARSSSPTRNQRSKSMDGNLLGASSSPGGVLPTASISAHSAALKSKSSNFFTSPRSIEYRPWTADVFPLLLAPTKIEISSSSSMTTSRSRR